jgi:hypothetical protein
VKLGAENRKMTYAAIGLMALAVLLVARWLYSMSDTTSASARPPATVASAPSPVPATATRTRTGKKVRPPRSLDPTLRYDFLKSSEDTIYTGHGRNIFQAQMDIPKPIKMSKPIPVQLPPPGPAPPPPINLKFFGFANKPGQPKKIFLSQGEDVFIAGEGDIVDRRYRVLRISPASVEVEDVLNNNRQSIPLTQG